LAPRRPKGTGSIYVRKDGRVIGQYEVDTTEGKKTKYVSGKTKKEVARKLAQAIADGKRGVAYNFSHLTLGQYLDRWIDNLKYSLRHSTWRRHEVNVRVHLKPALGNVKLNKLTPLQIQSVYRHKLDQGLSAATVVKIHSTLSKSLKQAVRWQLVKNNVCTAADPPRPTKPEIKPLTTSQLKQCWMLLETMPSTPCTCSRRPRA
jgi:integrase